MNLILICIWHHSIPGKGCCELWYMTMFSVGTECAVGKLTLSGKSALSSVTPSHQ